MRNDIWSEELLEQADDEIDRLRSENEDLAERIDELMDEIDELKKHEWISVKDRLPEDDVLVLAFGVGGIVIAEHYRFGQWVIFMLDKDGRYMSPYPTTIYYWMPLPEPPEVEIV